MRSRRATIRRRKVLPPLSACCQPAKTGCMLVPPTGSRTRWVLAGMTSSERIHENGNLRPVGWRGFLQCVAG